MSDALFEGSEVKRVHACGGVHCQVCELDKSRDAYLPYAGTSGWSGSDTSRKRAASADRGGKTSLRQSKAVSLLTGAGSRGFTWKELSAATGLHHGSASGALSVLHKVGVICRLTESRDGCKVYVMPQFTGDRDTESQGRERSCPHCGGEL